MKANVYIPSKDFNSSKGEYKERTISITDPDSNGNIYFSCNLDKHVFDKLKNTSTFYKTKENGGNFKRNVKGTIYKYVVDLINQYGKECEDIKSLEDLNKEKKIFVNFSFNSEETRDNWYGADTGNLINISFQYFVGYKTSTMRCKLSSYSFENSKNEEECIRYLSRYKSLVKENRNHKDGSLQPLNMDWEHSKIEEKYNIIDWTQEREDFIEDLEKAFNILGNKLSSFLKNLDSKSLDVLINQKHKLLS